jgi:hypothetical protein
VEIASVTGAMTMERGTDLVCAGFSASVAVAVKLKVPLAVGDPEMIPVLAARLRPDGRLPVIDQV